MEIYQYPSNLNDDKYGGHSVSITVIEYERKASAGSGDSGNAPVASNAPSVNNGSAFYSFNYTEKQVGAIKLHIPQSVVSNSEVNWDREEFGLVGSFTKFVGSKGFFSGQSEEYESGIDMYNDIVEFGGELKNHFISKLAKELGGLAAFTGVPVYDIYMKSRRQAVNPHTELIFRGITPRTFPFNYTFRPKNPQEAREINNIILMLKRNMAPKISGEPGASYGRFYEYPNEFDIEFLFRNQQNQFITKIARCVLESCNVSYGNQGNFNTFIDGFPTEIEMNLQFSETKVITRDLIDEGYY